MTKARGKKRQNRGYKRQITEHRVENRKIRRKKENKTLIIWWAHRKYYS